MSAARLRVVARIGPTTIRTRWFAASLVAHLALSAVVVLWPSRTRAIRGPIGPSIAVDLVAGPPSRPRAAPARTSPPQERPDPAETKPLPKPEPREATLDTRDVKLGDEPKKVEPEPQAEAPPTEVEQPDDAGEGDDAGGGVDGPTSADESVAGDFGAGGTALGSEYAWYGARVTAALRAQWRRPPLGNVRESLTVVVAFDILRNGMVRDVRIVESSGVASLDRSALRAVADAAPLPALPRALDAPTVPARFEFTWYPGDS